MKSEYSANRQFERRPIDLMSQRVWDTHIAQSTLIWVRDFFYTILRNKNVRVVE